MNFRRVLPFVLSSAAVVTQPARAQTLAADRDQRLVELAAAAYIGGEKPPQAVGSAVDPRFAAGEVPIRSVDNRFELWRWPDSLSFQRPPAHDTTQLAKLVAALGAKEILDDASVCRVPAPAVCRLGSFRSLVAFSPAMVRADTAQVVLFGWFLHEGIAKGTGDTARWTVAAAWWFTLERSGAEWKVARVLTIRS